MFSLYGLMFNVTSGIAATGVKIESYAKKSILNGLIFLVVIYFIYKKLWK